MKTILTIEIQQKPSVMARPSLQMERVAEKIQSLIRSLTKSDETDFLEIGIKKENIYEKD